MGSVSEEVRDYPHLKEGFTKSIELPPRSDTKLHDTVTYPGASPHHSRHCHSTEPRLMSPWI